MDTPANVLPALGAYRIDRIRVADLQRWLDEQLPQAAVHTVRARWGQLRALLRSACAEHELTDPTRGIRAPRAPKRGGRSLTLMPDDIPRVLDACKVVAAAWYPMVGLGLATGARASELVACRVGDLDLDLHPSVGCWNIAQHLMAGKPIPGTKNCPEPEPVYLARVWCDELRPYMTSRLPGEYLVRGNRRNAWPSTEGLKYAPQRISVACELERLSSKVFRQTVATLGQLGGVASVLVQAHLRHASLSTTDVYTRPSDDQRIRAAQRLGEVIPLHKAGKV